jgi:4-hydroxybenzoyl-CoA thioesterase
MFVNRRDVQIQWGDCDPANIVYYPRYFAMFDDSTSIMFEAAGYSKQDLIHKYGLVGIPMVDTRAKPMATGSPSKAGSKASSARASR